MYDLVVIGGGSAGRSVAAAAARVGARVALVVKNAPAEKDSASVCWPSMGLFQAARLARELSGGVRFGVTMGTPQSDFRRGDGARAGGGTCGSNHGARPLCSRGKGSRFIMDRRRFRLMTR